ncbi:MAG: hypothetical protein KJP16_13480 [Gammaproteobacteria bacterium]|nr:hypothetical protein [Gammaproteobacteria bacterium]NNC57497.1 hypothetical protein [Woeseiaceae bacterium]NNL51818.1 hypothetical protein [Woeseiaceae bacterium]
MSSKRYCVVSGVFFFLVAVAHLLRIIYGMPVQVDEYAVPMNVSWFAVIVPGALAYWAFRLTGSGSTA